MSDEQIVQIIHHAAEGVGVRASARLLNINKDTVNRVILRALWQELGHAGPVADVRWPEPDPDALRQDTIEVVVQVNGKLRSRVTLPVGADEAAARDAALADANVQKFIDGKPLRKLIYVPGKLVNVVV